MRIRFSRRFAFWTLVLFSVWLLLSESVNPLHIWVGLAASFCVAALNAGGDAAYSASVRWWQMLLYLPWLFGRILASGIHLAYLILHPRLPIGPKLFRYRTELDTEEAVMLLGNSITLTPGTITVEASSEELLVHAIDEDSAKDVASRRLETKVAAVFRSGGGRR